MKKPYIIVVYSKLPAQGEIPSKENWGQKAKWAVTENAYFEDSITNNRLFSASFIMDLTDNKVLKNRFGKENEEQLVKHFSEKYKDKIQLALWRWKNV